MKVKFTSTSRRRLTQIKDKHSKKRSREIIGSVRKHVKHLEDYPELGKVEKYLEEEGKGHRSIVIDKLYKLIYLIAAPFIFITDIFDVQQDPEKMKP
ncbi:MAG: type II toxin-antitoxin system RelE/ParE family toxin [Bacteroidota bacterium]